MDAFFTCERTTRLILGEALYEYDRFGGANAMDAAMVERQKRCHGRRCGDCANYCNPSAYIGGNYAACLALSEGNHIEYVTEDEDPEAVQCESYVPAGCEL